MAIQGFGINGKSYYTNVSKPIDINFNFIVDSTNGNGLGIRSLKSNGAVKSVFMHTTAPLAGSGNPNPIAGVAQIQFSNNFNKYLGGFSGQVSPTTGGTIVTTAAGAALTVGTPYIIASLGNTSLADWHTLGLPVGLTPTVGQVFIALVTGVGTGTGLVIAAGASGVDSMEVIGNANTMISNSNTNKNGGAILIVQFLKSAVLTAPADGSVVGMCARFDGSSVTIDGL